MVVADSSLPRRSSSAHRICIRATGRAERLPASTPAPTLALQPPAGQNAGRPSPLLAAIRPRRGRPRGDATAAGTVYYAKRHSTRPPCPHTHTRGEVAQARQTGSCWFHARGFKHAQWSSATAVTSNRGVDHSRLPPTYPVLLLQRTKVAHRHQLSRPHG